ncbi:hypothetical protein CCP3SC1_40059 [Gammaproteobacteria bacterium]
MNRNLVIPVFFLIYSLTNITWGVENSFEEFLHKGKEYFNQGQYFLALDDLQSAQARADTLEQRAQANGMLGLTHYQMRHREQANALLRQAIDSGTGDIPDRVHWTTTLADLQANQGQFEYAHRLYADATKIAGDDPELRTTIHLRQAISLSPEQRLAELVRIHHTLGDITNSIACARYLLDLGTQAQELGITGLKLAYTSFEQARQKLDEQQPRLLADALDGLAQLYEDQKRYNESLHLNQQAILLGQRIAAHDLLLELEWRQARLYRNLQQPAPALAAYQRTVEHVEAIRQDLPLKYHHGRSSFREILEPIYLGLADLLLAEAKKMNGEGKTELLYRAREAVELIKASELEDFLGGRCAIHRNQSTLLEAVDPTTAILYPILLPERLELLVSSGGEIRQYTQSVSAATLQGLTHQLARGLRVGKSNTKTIAQQLYGWLIAPAQPWLHQRQVQTLVMVPDGVLRLIPPAALYDGRHYLIEDYALATSPGLTLFGATPLQQQKVKILLAGMSEPGAVIEHLPPASLQNLIDGNERGFNLDQAPPPPPRLTDEFSKYRGNR